MTSESILAGGGEWREGHMDAMGAQLNSGWAFTVSVIGTLALGVATEVCDVDMHGTLVQIRPYR